MAGRPRRAPPPPQRGAGAGPGRGRLPVGTAPGTARGHRQGRGGPWGTPGREGERGNPHGSCRAHGESAPHDPPRPSWPAAPCSWSHRSNSGLEGTLKTIQLQPHCHDRVVFVPLSRGSLGLTRFSCLVGRGNILPQGLPASSSAGISLWHLEVSLEHLRTESRISGLCHCPASSQTLPSSFSIPDHPVPFAGAPVWVPGSSSPSSSPKVPFCGGDCF